jgi:hypothetical protein
VYRIPRIKSSILKTQAGTVKFLNMGWMTRVHFPAQTDILFVITSRLALRPTGDFFLNNQPFLQGVVLGKRCTFACTRKGSSVSGGSIGGLFSNIISTAGIFSVA